MPTLAPLPAVNLDVNLATGLAASLLDQPVASDEAGDTAGMAFALVLARRAAQFDEVPVGAILVRDGRVVAAAHNETRARCDPTAHAELLCVQRACARLGAARLPGAVVYSTVEPCFLCAGALSHARVARVVWAVRDPKFGGCVSLGAVLTDPRLNHRARITEGVGADEARALLQQFFRSKRGRDEGPADPAGA